MNNLITLLCQFGYLCLIGHVRLKYLVAGIFVIMLTQPNDLDQTQPTLAYFHISVCEIVMVLQNPVNSVSLDILKNIIDDWMN